MTDLLRDLSIYGVGTGALVGSIYYGARRAAGSEETYLKTVGFAVGAAVTGATLPQLVFGPSGGIVGMLVLSPLLGLGGGVASDFV